jgi:hypothetical protein
MNAMRVRASEIHRRPTPHPGFDVAKFARESERRLHVEPNARASIPPPLTSHLHECKSRIALLRSELAVGGLSREEAANVLRVELSQMATSARCAEAPALVEWLKELADALGELGGPGARTQGDPLHVLVVDGDASARERIALAVESLGHAARSGATVREVEEGGDGQAPDILVISAAQAGSGPEPGLGAAVRELARGGIARIVLYASSAATDTSAAAEAWGAHRCVCPPGAGVDALTSELGPILDMAW